jgi:hypothetical protein
MYLFISLLSLCLIILLNFLYEFLIAFMRLGETHEKINDIIYFILFTSCFLWASVFLSYIIYFLISN